MKTMLLACALLTWTLGHSQHSHHNVKDISPDGTFENISVKKLDSDARVSTFIIWVKKEVKEHYHAEHSEVVIVVEGMGTMTLGAETFEIGSGDYIFIPKGSAHSVVVKGATPLKVLSIQTPEFDGSDRVFTEK